MSSKPNMDGVKDVLAILDAMTKLEHEIMILRGSVAKLHKCEEELGQKKIDLWAKLDGMDVSSSGNYGFGERMTWFLQKMAQTAHAQGYIARRDQEEKKGEKPECCERPPNGWFCTLPAGHDGPCPTVREGSHCDKTNGLVVCGHKRPCPTHDNNVKRSG